MNSFFQNADVITWNQSCVDEFNNRANIDFESLCSYGIKALDDPLGGILPDDLVVIGADSGSGKSELALRTAIHNARNGKRVCLFYLEGGYTEAIARMKWPLIAQRYYKYYNGQIKDFNYVNWRKNGIRNKLIFQIEAEVINELNEQVKDRLWICKITRDFTLDNMLNALYSFDNLERFMHSNFQDYARNTYDLDLIVIDHLQYFAFDEKESEIASITKILKEVKYLADLNHLPVVLVSHLKKKSKDRGLPSQDDFYGSSNIPKIASTAIMLMSDTQNIDHANQIYPTWIRIGKSRVGISDSIAINVDFDLKNRQYSDVYKIHKIDQAGNPVKDFIPVDKLPAWAMQNTDLVEALNHDNKQNPKEPESIRRFRQNRLKQNQNDH